MCELFHSLWDHFSPLSTYQQQRRVDVDVFKHNELFLGFDGHHPGSVQLGFHPVPHAAVLPLEGSGQSPEEREIRHVGGLSGTVLHAVSSCFYSSSTTGTQQSGALLKECGGGESCPAAIRRLLRASALKVELALTTSHMLSWFRLPAVSTVRESAANKTLL